MAAHPTLSTGKAIVKVVKRCDRAKEEQKLDLSGCTLAKVPDAIFLLMKHTSLVTCNLSRNTLRRIPPKVGLKFSNLRELQLDHNNLESLPDDLKNLSSLRDLDIAHNRFTHFPRVVFKLHRLRHLNAEGNLIREVAENHFRPLEFLVEVNLRDNPLSDRSRREMDGISTFSVLIGYDESDDSDSNDAGSTESSSPR